jgi:two-component system chemotaxis response regulator CheY
MKTLIVEDEVTAGMLLKAMLSPYGECVRVGSGREGIDAFRVAGETGSPFDLVCLDIMLPDMDGPAVLKEIRGLEGPGGRLAKVIMTTGVSDMNTVFASFKEVCNAYLVKPIDREKLLGHLRDFGLVDG